MMRTLLTLFLLSSLVVHAAPPATRLNPNEEGATKIVEQIKPAIVKITQLGFDGVDGLGTNQRRIVEATTRAVRAGVRLF